jgi:AraC-like DNA-binding protein
MVGFRLFAMPGLSICTKEHEMVNEFEIVPYSNIKHVNCFLVDIAYRTPHRHNDIELNLILEGSIVLNALNNSIVAHEGDLLLFNSNQSHELTSQNGRSLILCLQISPKFFNKLLPSLANLYFDTLNVADTIVGDRLTLCRSLIIEFAYQYFLGNPTNYLTCNAILNLLMRIFISDIPYHTISDDEMKKTMQRTARLNRILSYIEENYMNKLLLSDIAERENLTTSYLSHFIKDNLNQSFQDYLNTLRLNHAKFLVATTNKRLIDICIECGFSDYRYLYKSFKDKFGCTPNEYRKKYSGNIETSRKAAMYSNEVFLSDKDALKYLTKLHEIIKPVLRDSGDLIWSLN